jgi:hypothetical protein
LKTRTNAAKCSAARRAGGARREARRSIDIEDDYNVEVSETPEQGSIELETALRAIPTEDAAEDVDVNIRAYCSQGLAMLLQERS